MSELLPNYSSSLYYLAYQYGEAGYPARLAEYFGQPGSIEITPDPRYLGGHVVVDGEISFGVSKFPACACPDALGSMSILGSGEPVVVQLQGIGIQSERLISKWPFVLIGIAEEVARMNNARSIAIQPGELNLHYPGEKNGYIYQTNGQALEKVRDSLKLRYNGTAKKAGYKKGEDGLYHKTLTS